MKRRFSSTHAGIVSRRRQGFRSWSPLNLPNLKLWVDPRGAKETLYGAKFIGSDSRYLACADHASLAITNKFTVAFERSLLYRPVSGSAADLGYVGQANGNNGWQISAGDETDGQNSIRVILGTGSGLQVGATAQTSETLENGGSSHVVVVYDGAAADGAELVIYFDGADAGATLGTINDSLSDSTGTFQVGRNPLLAGAYHTCAMRNLIFWNNRALTGAEVATLYNGGYTASTRPLTYSQLGSLATGVAGAWLMNETTGTRTDASGNGNHLTEQGGAIARAESVIALAAKFPRGLIFRAPYQWAPLYEGDSALGPALHFYGQHGMRATMPTGFPTACGDIIYAHRNDSLLTSAMAHVCLYDEGNANDLDFWYPSIIGAAAPQFHLRQWQDGAGVNDRVDSTKNDFAADTNYVWSLAGLGTGGASSFTMHWNGTATAATPNNADIQNCWTDDLIGPDTIALGGFVTGLTASGYEFWQGRLDGWLSHVVMTGGAVGSNLNAIHRNRCERYIGQRCGVTIA